MPLPAPKVAFVAGCTGVSGNAIAEYLIRLPTEEWSRIIVSSRSPLKNYWQDPRVEFLQLDFLDPVATLMQKMQQVCKDVTHAYFAAYVHADGWEKPRDLNVLLFENFLTAIDTIAGESLQRVCLQTGGKHYGAHLGPTETPLYEELGRFDDQGTNFYYMQEDFLFKLHATRKWSWNVIQPNGIIGFTPGKNGMSEAITLALYMIVSKELGEIPKFPGNKYFYNSVDDQSYAKSIADMSIWATTHEHTKNESFIHTNGDMIVWRYFFPKIGKYFGLDIPDQTEWEVLGEDQKYAHSFRMEDWAKDKEVVWKNMCEKYGGNPEAFNWGTWQFFDWCLGKGWPTVSSVSKARKFGWKRYDDTYQTWVETFRTFENAGVLPRNYRQQTSSGVNGVEGEAKPYQRPPRRYYY
ncbi:nucleoside-diphosphate-sugar epimerase GsfE [Cadophora sp. MPI-SDFR-AT-0126]|nr:nucleoside-diphosphate-sugar epimerase GsfE [Leotiomycetes sp. MPI-SDFR-AT-0126]